MERIKKHVFWGVSGVLFFLVHEFARADSAGTIDGDISQAIKSGAFSFAHAHAGKFPDDWQELGDWLSTVGGNTTGAKDYSMRYVFISSAERVRFTDGELIAISAEPIPWPFARISYSVSPEDVTPEMLQQLEAQRTTRPPIRYLIYRDKTGNPMSMWWHEDRVQAMLKETGITIPRPTPYYPKGPDGEYLPLTPQAVEALVRLDLTDTIPPELLAKMQATGTLPANFTAKSPRGNNATPGANSSATAPSTLAQIISSPWLGWVLAIAVALAAALYLRRQRIGRR